MNGISAIAGRELKVLFASPVAWFVLGVTQAGVAFEFLSQAERFDEWQSRLGSLPGAPGLTQIVVEPHLWWAGILLTVAVPILTMRVVSEERRTGSLALLLSAPVSMAEIVLGKYLGVMAFVVLAVALVGLMPLTLLAGGTLDLGILASGLVGLFLLAAGFAAAGVYVSTLTAQPAVAAIGTVGLLALLWLLGMTGTSAAGPGRLTAYLSQFSHYRNLVTGVVDTADLAYFLLFVTLFLALAVGRLERDRTLG